MFIDFNNIELSGIHISTLDCEDVFIIQSKYLKRFSKKSNSSLAWIG